MKKLDSRSITVPRFKEILAVKGGLPSDIWLYFRYQVFSKILMVVVVMPIFHYVVQAIIALSGRTTVSSGDFKGFALSTGGLAFLVLGIVFVVFLLVIDVAAFAISEAARLKGKPLYSARELLWQALKSLPRFVHPATLILVAYVGLIVPLVGFGPKIPALEWIKIPNFISEVIFKTPLYLAIYSVVIVIFSVIAFFLAATVPAMFVDDLPPVQAMKKSVVFMRNYWKTTIGVLIFNLLVLVVYVGVVAFVLSVLSIIGTRFLPQDLTTVRFSAILLSLILMTAGSSLAFIIVPLQLRNFTRIYGMISQAGTLTDRNTTEIAIEDRQALPKIIVVSVAIFLGIIGISIVMAANFDLLFKQQNSIAVVAHRAGGDLDAENSLEGLEKAIDVGAQWSEIDIQRTKDGAYIVNHDASFSRMAGVSASAQELTVDEISKLQLKNHFNDGQPERSVATIEQMMDTAEGRIGLFIELKGASADRKMVDEMAAMIKKRGLEESMALISLDYDLVSYIESTYPELTSGYLYYFSVGDMTKLKGDYLIMEEGVASPETVERLHESGKKVIVWTVNTPESMDLFADSQVDGIITDYPRTLIEVMSRLALRSDVERIFDKIFAF